jgi:hypothetical protein
VVRREEDAGALEQVVRRGELHLSVEIEWMGRFICVACVARRDEWFPLLRSSFFGGCWCMWCGMRSIESVCVVIATDASKLWLAE